MHKQAKPTTKRSLIDYVERLSAKWQLRTLPNTPSKVEEGESTESILADLIAMPTVTGNYQANHEALSYIGKFLSKHGMHVHRHEHNGVESLVATTHATKSPTVFLAGHIDVVPAPSELFKLEERDDRYYGRGALDMKGAIAAYLGVVRDLQDTIANYDFGILITTDEEIGGLDGAAKLAEEGYRADIMILPDGGNNWNFEKSAKGIWHATLEATGVSAHGSRPWEGDNATDRLMIVLNEVKKLFPAQQTPDTNTLNIGIIQGGTAINQVPASATASIDTRYTSSADQQRIVQSVMKIAKKYNVLVTTEVDAKPVVNDPNHPLVDKFVKQAEEVLGRRVGWMMSNAGHDGRFFAEHDVPLAVTYPAGANHHGPQEYLEKQALQQMQQMFHRYILAIAHTKSDQRKPSTTG